jgi:glycosyltransferase involved in cell wall biosynthesis
MPPRISAIVHTLNEESRLPFALRSLRPWVDEIVVVDMRSDDRTAEIARSFGAVVYEHERVGYVEPARAFGVEKATGEWVMIVDADEIVPAPLAGRLRAVAEEGSCDAVLLPHTNWIFGAVIAHTGWGASQDGHYRFFRRGAVRFSSEIHGRGMAPVPGARVLDMTEDPDASIVHFNYVDVHDFLERLNRYTTIEAKNGADRGEHPSLLRQVRRPAQTFLWRFVRLSGWRDGWRGFALSGIMAFYRFVTEVKLRELAQGVSPEAISERYRSEAERLLREYSVDVAGLSGPGGGSVTD